MPSKMSPEESSHRASVFYWRRQVFKGRSDEEAMERVLYHTGVVEALRAQRLAQRARRPGRQLKVAKGPQGFPESSQDSSNPPTTSPKWDLYFS